MNSNPYPGPNEFSEEQSNLFFGRIREQRDIVALVDAQPVNLIYGRSGTGKSSLINAAIIPALHENAFDVLPKARLQGDIPKHIAISDIQNIYTFHVVMSVFPGITDSDAIQMTLIELLANHRAELNKQGVEKNIVLIIDQFEELFTTYNDQWAKRADFILQIREALKADVFLRVVLVMREDYVAELDSYSKILPRLTRSRYRVELLRREQALQAITEPLIAIQSTREFVDDAEKILVDRLRTSEDPHQLEASPTVSEYVEPVILQVVCNRLWEQLEPEVTRIGPSEVDRYAEIDNALSNYYDSCLKRVCQTPAVQAKQVTENDIRTWFDQHLITANQRDVILRGETETGGLPNEVVESLVDQHVIRSERHGARELYELVHDAFIDPITASNQKWGVTREKEELRLNLRKNFFQILAVVLTIALLIAVGLIILALDQRSQAEDARDLAEQHVIQLNASNAALNAAFDAQIAFYANNRSLALSLFLDINAIESPPPQLLAQFAYAPGARQRIQLESGINSIAYSPDGRTVLAGLEDSTLVLISTDSGEIVTVFKGHSGPVNAVGFSPDGQMVLSGSDDTTLRLWDVPSGDLTKTIEGHRLPIKAATFSSDGRAILSGAGMAGVFPEMILWDVQKAERITTFVGHNATIYSVAITPDGQKALSGSDDSLMYLWDMATGEVVKEFRNDSLVWSVAFSPDGTMAAGATIASSINLWDIESGNELIQFTDHDAQVKTVAFSPDGQRLVSGASDGSVFVWNLRMGAILDESAQPGYGEMEALFLPQNPNRVIFFGCRTIDDFETCVQSGQGIYSIWDLTTNSEVPLAGSVPEQAISIFAMDVSPDGQTAVAADLNGYVFTWDTQTGEVGETEFDTSGPVFSLAFTRDGSGILAGNCSLLSLCQFGDLVLWDATSGEQIRSFDHDDPSANRTVSAIAVSSQNDYFASGTIQGGLTLWNIATGDIIWHHAGGNELGLSDPEFVTWAEFSPDDSILITGHFDGSIKQWDVETGGLVRVFVGHSGTIEGLDFNPAGTLLASASVDGRVIVWDVANGKIIRQFDDHNSDVYSVKFAPDGKSLLSTGRDGTYIRWRMDTLDELLEWILANRYIPAN